MLSVRISAAAGSGGGGVCWVEFAEAADAARALLRNGQATGGHVLRVTPLPPPQPLPQLSMLNAVSAAEWYPSSTGGSLEAEARRVRTWRARALAPCRPRL